MGWSSPWVVAGFAASAALLPVFVWRSATAVYPVINLALFKVRQFRVLGISLYVALLGAAIGAAEVTAYRIWLTFGVLSGASGAVLSCRVSAGPNG